MTFGESLLDQLQSYKRTRFSTNGVVTEFLLPMIEQAVKEERKLRAAVIGTRDHALAFPDRDWQADHFGGRMDTAAHPLPPIPQGLNAAYIGLEHPHQFHPAIHAGMPSGSKCTDCATDNEPCPTCYSIYWARRHSAAQKPKETT